MRDRDYDPVDPPDPGDPSGGGTAPPTSPTQKAEVLGNALAMVIGTARVEQCPVIYWGPPVDLGRSTSGMVPYIRNPATGQLGEYKGTLNPAVYAICEAPVTDVKKLYHAHFGLGLDPGAVTIPICATWSTVAMIVSDTGVSAWAGYVGTGYEGMGHQGTVQLRYSACVSAESGVPRIFDAEVAGYGAGAGGESTDDAHPADVLKYLLTNSKNGLGLSASLVEVDLGLPDANGTQSAANSYRRYCSARNWYVSIAITERTPVTKLIEDLMLATDSALVLVGGKLTAVPYGDQQITRSSFTYTPNTTPVTIDANELIHDDDEPAVQVERRQEKDIFGIWPVSYRDRAQAYKEVTREYIDPVWTAKYGARRADAVKFDFVMTAEHAGWVTHALAQRAIYQRNKYKFKLGPRWALLTPMDFIALSDPMLGVSGLIVRVLSIEETEDGTLEVEALEWPLAGAEPIDLTPQSADGLMTTNWRPVAGMPAGGVPAGVGNLFWNARLYDAYGAYTGWGGYNNSAGSEPSTITGYATGGPDGGSYQRHAWTGTNTTSKGFYYDAQNLGYPQARTVADMVRVDTDYVFSWYARAGSAQSFGMEPRWNNAPSETAALENPNLATYWQRYAFRINWDSGATVDTRAYLTILYAAAMTGYVEVACVQLEEGSQPTPFATRPGEVLPGSVTREQNPPSLYDKDNLWPNPSSEISPPYGADTSQAEWADRYNAGGGAYGGSWVRRITSGQRGFWVPCAQGAQFYAQAQAKRTGGSGSGGRLRVAFTAVLGDLTGATYTNGAYTAGTVTDWNMVTVKIGRAHV